MDPFPKHGSGGASDHDGQREDQQVASQQQGGAAESNCGLTLTLTFTPAIALSAKSNKTTLHYTSQNPLLVCASTRRIIKRSFYDFIAFLLINI